MDGRAYAPGRRCSRSPMINVRSVDHVVLRVADVEKVGAFYIDVLGGRWDRRRGDIGLHHLRLGEMMIDLVPVEGQLGRLGGAARNRRVATSTMWHFGSGHGMGTPYWPR